MNRIQFNNMFKQFGKSRTLLGDEMALLRGKAFQVTGKVAGKNESRVYAKGLLGRLGAVPKIAKTFGKKTAAWDITARNINDLICCTHNISRDEAKAIELVSSNETNQEKQISMLVDKLSSLLVGRPFRAKFKGEQTKEGGTVFSTLDRVESMNVPSVATGLKFNLDKDIKMFLSPDKVNSSIGTAVKNDDLPF